MSWVRLEIRFQHAYEDVVHYFNKVSLLYHKTVFHHMNKVNNCTFMVNRHMVAL